MELVTIIRDPLFRDDGRGSGDVKLNWLCPRGSDVGFCPRGVADAVVGAGVDPRWGDVGFSSRGFAGAVVDA